MKPLYIIMHRLYHIIVRPRFLTYVNALVFTFILSSCEEFFSPEFDLIRDADNMHVDWEEYRSAGMGLYSLQQKLVDQIFILGELRGDLLTVTDNANPDLIEVNEFNIGRNNPYASPVNFYNLIIACNKLIHQISTAHPNVLDKNQPVNNYDRLFGEALCMRAWAYFNAVRIYGEVPLIPEAIASIEDIEKYVNSQTEFVIPEYIIFSPGGFHNDTIRDTTIILERRFLNEKAIIEYFTDQLENKIKAVGVNHSIYNDDETWQVTIWNNYARNVLLGQMYMTDQNYVKAIEYFNTILYNTSSVTSNIKFGLDNKFSRNQWRNIFTGLDPDEHIYTIWFGDAYKQTHNLQNLMSVIPPNKYMLKPTATSIRNWESIWDGPVYNLNHNNPGTSSVINPGVPGDFFRGYGVSYKYFQNGTELNTTSIRNMLLTKMTGNTVEVEILMDNVDTVAVKYEIGKGPFANDANFILYRAAGVHLYAAEIYAVWEHIYGGLPTPRVRTNRSLNILNNGSYNNNSNQLGVRGRVGFADGFEAVYVDNIVYIHDPVTNQIVGYHNFINELKKQKIYLTDKIMEERAREMAFEGERFYDLIRFARRFNDPSILAEKVAEKFQGAKREMIREKLMNEKNWYIDFYE